MKKLILMSINSLFIVNALQAMEQSELLKVDYGVAEDDNLLSRISKDALNPDAALSQLKKDKPMEDRWDSLRLPDEPSLDCFAIYDGHSGYGAAKYAKKHLLKTIISKVKSALEPKSFIARWLHGCDRKSTIVLAIKKAYREIETNFCTTVVAKANDRLKKGAFQLHKDALCQYDSGTTALVVLIDKLMKKLYVANVGDSGAILLEGNKFQHLTNAHRVSRSDERERICKAGGEIQEPGKYDEGFGRIVHIQNPRVQIGDHSIEVTRSLGDVLLKYQNPGVLIAEPDVYIYPLVDSTPQYIFMGCDGVCDYTGSQDIGSILHWWYFPKLKSDYNLSLSDLAQQLITNAKGSGSTDNLTAMVVKVDS